MLIRESDLSAQLIDNMRDQKIDISGSLDILNGYNNGLYSSPTVAVSGLPTIDGNRILDVSRISDTTEVVVPFGDAETLDCIHDTVSTRLGESLPFQLSNPMQTQHLKLIGTLLFPDFSYGLLNGGSATSYVDYEKNRGFDPTLFGFYEPTFTSLSSHAKGKPKGTTPGFLHPDGSAGPSFMELKIRALLLQVELFSECGSVQLKDPIENLLFQMTSDATHDSLIEHMIEMQDFDFMHSVGLYENLDSLTLLMEKQPLISAFTHSEEGRQKAIFDRAYGKPEHPLALPGGHGQCFEVLETTLRALKSAGKRYVSLGNVDNNGYFFDPVTFAIFALSGKQAAFDFSLRTSVDVKGGILVLDERQRLTCADIGPAVSEADLETFVDQGQTPLFNCASGFFDLDYLVSNIDLIKKQLPVRFSDQSKDAGRYSQAERVTWEVMGILDDYLVFAVEKRRRFLAAKLLLETFLTSGLGIDDDAFPATEGALQMRETAHTLNAGLHALLETVYGLNLESRRWVPDQKKT